MGRVLKYVGGAVVVLVIIIAGGVWYLSSNVDSLVKDAVEEYGPQFTGVTVKLNKVELSAKNGTGKLSGLLVGNPQGYKSDSAFKLGSIAVEIDLGSLLEDTIVIRKIEIDKPDVTYEFGPGGSNIDVIGKNVEKAAGGSGGGTAEKKEGGGKKMVIDSLVVSNGNVSVSHPMLSGKKISAPLPTIRLKDIGKDKKDGASPAEVVDKVMDAVEKQVAGAVGSLNVDGMLKDAGKAAEGVMKGVSEGAGSAGKGAEDAVKGAGDTLKKMFGK